MSIIKALPEELPEHAGEELKALYAKVSEHAGRVTMEARMMGQVPAFADDMFDNHHDVLKEGLGHLDLKQREAIALAVSSANQCVNCVKSHRRKCLDVGYSEEQVVEILGITSLCAMYNTVWTFRHLVDDEQYMKMATPLKADAMSESSLGPLLVELICVAVSTIRECKLCVKAHTKKAIKADATPEMINETIMVAAVMTAYNLYFRLNH